MPPPGLERVVRSVPEPAVVLVLTHRVRDAWPLILEAHAVSASRLPSSWWLAALYREELSRPGPVVTRAPEEMSQLESRLFEMTIQDVVRRPDVIITWRPTSELWGRGRLHVMEYLMQDARAAAALQDYQREPVGPFVVWKRDAHTF